MSGLIRCKTCGWEVSSAARLCPHCGEPNCKPASCLSEEQRKRQLAEEQKRQIDLDGMDRQYGYSLEVYAEGEIPENWYKRILFLGSKITPYANTGYAYDDEKHAKGEPVHVRLLPGTYTVRYSEYYYAGLSPNEIRSEATFSISNSDRKVFLHFQKKMLSKHYKLTSITVG